MWAGQAAPARGEIRDPHWPTVNRQSRRIEGCASQTPHTPPVCPPQTPSPLRPPSHRNPSPPPRRHPPQSPGPIPSPPVCSSNCMYTALYTYIHMYVYGAVNVHIYEDVCVFVLYVYSAVYIHTCVCIQCCIHAYIYRCAYVCMHVYSAVYMHIHLGVCKFVYCMYTVMYVYMHGYVYSAVPGTVHPPPGTISFRETWSKSTIYCDIDRTPKPTQMPIRDTVTRTS